MMNGSPHLDASNDALLRQLGLIAERLEPAPALVYQLGYAAFAFRSLDAELAELVDDSALQADELAGVRGDSDVRMLFYQASELAVELHVTRREGRHSALGQVVGGSVTAVRVESLEREETLPIDDLGRFDVDDLPRGPFRIHLVDPGQPVVITDWTIL
jgi:hypothetical protein